MATSDPQAKTMSSRTGALVILIIGIIALGGGYMIYRQGQIPPTFTTTTGTVTSSAPGLNNNTYDIGIQFVANDGKTYKFTSSVPKASADHNTHYFVGENTIKVAYNPANPGNNPKNANNVAMSVTAILIMILGGLFTFIGAISSLQQLVSKK